MNCRGRVERHLIVSNSTDTSHHVRSFRGKKLKKYIISCCAFRVSSGGRIIKFRISGVLTNDRDNLIASARPLVLFVSRGKSISTPKSVAAAAEFGLARVSARAAPVSTHDSGALLYSCKHKYSFSRFRTFSVWVLYTHHKTLYIMFPE